MGILCCGGKSAVDASASVIINRKKPDSASVARRYDDYSGRSSRSHGPAVVTSAPPVEEHVFGAPPEDGGNDKVLKWLESEGAADDATSAARRCDPNAFAPLPPPAAPAGGDDSSTISIDDLQYYEDVRAELLVAATATATPVAATKKAPPPPLLLPLGLDLRASKSLDAATAAPAAAGDWAGMGSRPTLSNNSSGYGFCLHDGKLDAGADFDDGTLSSLGSSLEIRSYVRKASRRHGPAGAAAAALTARVKSASVHASRASSSCASSSCASSDDGDDFMLNFGGATTQVFDPLALGGVQLLSSSSAASAAAVPVPTPPIRIPTKGVQDYLNFKFPLHCMLVAVEKASEALRRAGQPEGEGLSEAHAALAEAVDADEGYCYHADLKEPDIDDLAELRVEALFAARARFREALDAAAEDSGCLEAFGALADAAQFAAAADDDEDDVRPSCEVAAPKTAAPLPPANEDWSAAFFNARGGATASLRVRAMELQPPERCATPPLPALLLEAPLKSTDSGSRRTSEAEALLSVQPDEESSPVLPPGLPALLMLQQQKQQPVVFCHTVGQEPLQAAKPATVPSGGVRFYYRPATTTAAAAAAAAAPNAIKNVGSPRRSVSAGSAVGRRIVNFFRRRFTWPDGGAATNKVATCGVAAPAAARRIAWGDGLPTHPPSVAAT